jgi:predicted RNase H-like HicB family nuclease
MSQIHRLTCVIEREGNGYISLCPELDIASQGDNVEEARRNLTEAIELFLETADPSEVQSRMRTEVYVTPIEVAVG